MEVAYLPPRAPGFALGYHVNAHDDHQRWPPAESNRAVERFRSMTANQAS
jgi:hypothetical protein